MSTPKTLLNNCLYFTASSLARQMQTMAEACFRPTGLNPSQGFALMCIVEEPGIMPSEIANRLHLKPSSVTRIVEALARQDLVTTEVQGRRRETTATAAGRRAVGKVRDAWKALHDDYSAVLGRRAGDALCRDIDQAADALAERADGV